MKIGDTFGNLTVVSDRYKPDPQKYPYFVDCECGCGSGVKPYRCVSLTKQKNPTKSCGCLQRQFASQLKVEVTKGTVFGRLTVQEDLGVDTKSSRKVLVSCECGSAPFSVRYNAIATGHTQSCGCLQKEVAYQLKAKHMMSDRPEYDSWQSMKERCRNSNTVGYENYGGRGITYDPEWESFEAFYADMGDRPEGMTLDRINVDGNYSKENCRWATKGVQSFNRRKQQDCTSMYVGVYWDKAREKWVARLHKEGVVLLQKRFLTEEAAARAYDEACLQHYGVRKNFPEES